MGALALLVAALAVGLSPRQRPGATAMSRLSTRAQDALQTRPLWVPFILGVGLFTDFRYLLALSAIAASRVTAGTRYRRPRRSRWCRWPSSRSRSPARLAAPEKTGKIMSQLNDWLRTRRHQVFALIIALPGVFLLATGMGHI